MKKKLICKFQSHINKIDEEIVDEEQRYFVGVMNWILCAAKKKNDLCDDIKYIVSLYSVVAALQKRVKMEMLILSFAEYYKIDFLNVVRRLCCSCYDNCLALNNGAVGYPSGSGANINSPYINVFLNLRKRCNFPPETITILKEWLTNNKNDPYPTPQDKFELARRTNLTLKQIENWFVNARRRYFRKKNGLK